MSENHEFKTTGKIAEFLGEPLHRIEYILRTRKHITPLATGGGLRFYDSEAIAKIKSELEMIDNAKGTRV
tara:strand:+ start:54157 stop:54366 length:210 start_codon:yes stop_codon:yes gene_type:complete